MWKDKLEEVSLLPCGANIPIILVGNKSDIPEISLEESKKSFNLVAKEFGFTGNFLTCAKSGETVDDAFDSNTVRRA